MIFLEAVAAPLTGGMQILKVGKMVSLVGADEETFKRVPWIAMSFTSTHVVSENKSLIKKGLPPHLLSPSFLTGIRQAHVYLEHLGTHSSP